MFLDMMLIGAALTLGALLVAALAWVGLYFVLFHTRVADKITDAFESFDERL